MTCWPQRYWNGFQDLCRIHTTSAAPTHQQLEWFELRHCQAAVEARSFLHHPSLLKELTETYARRGTTACPWNQPVAKSVTDPGQSKSSDKAIVPSRAYVTPVAWRRVSIPGRRSQSMKEGGQERTAVHSCPESLTQHGMTVRLTGTYASKVTYMMYLSTDWFLVQSSK